MEQSASQPQSARPARTGVLKRVYLYLVSLIALVMIIIACVSLINLGLKAFVFTKADNDYTDYSCPAVVAAPAVPCDNAMEQQQAHEQLVSSNEQEASHDLALLIVGLPVFFYHWRLVRKETD